MAEVLRKLSALFTRARTIPFLGGVDAHIQRLPPGDRFIALILGGLVLAAGLAGTYTLTRSFLVEIPATGGTVVEGVLGSPRFVNPLMALSDADRDLVALTFAGLMGIGSEGELVPVLAHSYEISEDGRIYTFVLREGLEFSDGSPLTAEDIVFTVVKAQDPGLKSPELGNWAGIIAEAVDARTVRFTLPKAYAPFLESTTLGILPSRLWRDIPNEEFPFSRLMSEPVGSGPFKVVAVKRGGGGTSEYELAAFEGFALGRAYLDRIRVVFFSRETDLADALARGAIDSAYGVASPEAMRAPFAQVFGVFLNADQNPLFAAAEVRHALSVAVDRDAISYKVLGGFAAPAWGPLPSLQSTAERFDTEADRLARAAEVLEDGGWAYDTEALVWKHAKKGLQLSVTLRTSNVPELKAVAEALREDWRKLGVATSIELYEPGDLTQNVIRPRRFDALLFGMVVGREQDLYAFWHSSQRNDPGLNVSSYANRSVDELLEELRVPQTEEEREEMLAQVESLIASEYPAIFTHTPEFVYAAPEGVEGVAFTSISAPSDRFASVSMWYKNTESVWPFLTE